MLAHTPARGVHHDHDESGLDRCPGRPSGGGGRWRGARERGARARPPTPASELRREVLGDDLIDDLIARAGQGGIALTGEGGFLPELIRTVLERGLAVELSDHLGYDKGDPAGPVAEQP